MKAKKENGKFSFRILFTVVFDLMLAVISFFFSYTYMTGHISGDPLGMREFATYFCVYAVAFFVANLLLGAYRKSSLSSLYKSIPIAIVSILVSHMVSGACLFYVEKIMLDVIITSSVICTVLLLIARVMHKYLFELYYSKNVSEISTSIHTLIIGAGFSGKMVYHELMECTDNEYLPVCFVDDNIELIGTEVCGIPVFGPSALIPELCKKFDIGMIVFAIPSCDKKERARILQNCKEVDCQVRILPTLDELTKKNGGYFNQSVNVDVEKLLGRDAIHIKNDKVEEFIDGKTCLITGGGGSIGSELCRQIVRMNPKKLVILDIYENNAYEIQQELLRAGFSRDIVVVEIASVRDRKKIDAIFEKHKFDVVFHAAAHKHVPLMEDNPEEAIKNNVLGTYNVAHMCHKYSVEKMVLISTDKAVNPTNVMGASKRLCEMIMQYMSQTYTKTKFAAVRFGNVLGSNGSVIPLFTKQIEKGGPLTVTHPDIIRYFMTIPEAVSLVLEAGTMSTGGEIFVLDMGEPVKIVTLAENLIKMYGLKPYTDIEINFCGLRPGEKLFEELLMSDENLKETYNSKIFINDQLEVDCDNIKENLQEIIDVANANNSKETVKLLHKFVPTFKLPEEINSQKVAAIK